MTNHQEQTALSHRLGEVLGPENAATLLAMLPPGGDLATRDDPAQTRNALKGDITALRDELKRDITALRDELKGDMSELRSELALIHTEMSHRYATKDDLWELKRDFDASFHAYVRTFTATQAATVVGVSGIVFGLTRFL